MEVFLNDVILSFPDLRKRGKPPKDRPTEPGVYGCQGIFDIDSEPHKRLRAAVIAVAKEKWPDGWENIIKSLEKNKKCLRLGDHNLDAKGQQREEYKGKMFVRATNKEAVMLIGPKAKIQVKQVDGSMKEEWNILPPESGKPYGGCVVNLKIDVYAMNTYGNAINATLLAVQFVRDGKAFGAGAPSADGFEDVEGADFGEGDQPMEGEEVGSNAADLGI